MTRVLRNQHDGSKDGGVDVPALSAELRRAIRDGEARFDLGTRAAYAHDPSNFRQMPLGVVLQDRGCKVRCTNIDLASLLVEVLGLKGSIIFPHRSLELSTYALTIPYGSTSL